MWAYPELRTLADMPRYHARYNPDLPAIRCADRHMTHGERHTDSSRLANGLLAQMRG